MSEPRPITIWHGIAAYRDPVTEMQNRTRCRDYLTLVQGKRPNAELDLVESLGRETVRAAVGREPQ